MILVLLGTENLSLILINSFLINLYNSFFEFMILFNSIIIFDKLLISFSISFIPKAVSFCNLNSRIAATCFSDKEHEIIFKD